MFTVEECNSSSGISELTNARECALQYIRNLNKDDNPIILWLDDDLAFDALIVRDNQVHLSRPWSFFHEVWRFHESNPEVEIGLGDVTGAPPLPSSSTLLTNLTDLESAITGAVLEMMKKDGMNLIITMTSQTKSAVLNLGNMRIPISIVKKSCGI